jgi:two-component system sensor histidine kinase CssS
MKNLPLSLQIWLVIAGITLSISIVLAVLFPWTLRDFFTKEIYATIESAQRVLLARTELNREIWELRPFANQSQPLDDVRAVNHLIFVPERESFIFFRGPWLPQEFLNKVREQIREQTKECQRYTGQIADRKLFYVITRSQILGEEIFLISYMWDSYRQDLVQTLFKKLLLVMSLVFLLSWFPALGLAKYLSNPLVALERRVKKLANREWQEPVLLQRKDEIGKLGESIEQLRKQLIHQDELQQTFLQHVSHELKTPVMVIRSYVQSILDGIYPKGDLTSTVQVIAEEAKRLETLIRNLLYLTKLDYLATHRTEGKVFELSALIKEVTEKMRWLRSELDWSLKLSPTKIKGDIQQWRVALENLLDNQIRYAKEQITVSLFPLRDDSEKALVHIWNDGPHIEQGVMENLFQKFTKGPHGEFGLGLAVVQRVAALHNAKIWAVNEEKGGVSFYLEIPVAPNP